MKPRRRLDAELVRRGAARSRQDAVELIAAGRVTVAGAPALKAATEVDTVSNIAVRDPVCYASRAAYKLLSALEAFEPLGLMVDGSRCLDAGASTGGFSDVLLRRGAASVAAVDVGYGQIEWRLRCDSRLTVHDRTNVRYASTDVIGHDINMVVSDLSFISLTVVIPALASVCRTEGDMVLMIKPQFEVGKNRVGKGGVVHDRDLHAEAITAVCGAAYDEGWGTRAVEPSGLAGPSGNIEYFCWLRTDAPSPDPALLTAAVGGGHE